MLYFTRQPNPVIPNVPSPTNFEFSLGHGGDANDTFVEVNSIARYNVASSGANGSLAILETINT